MVPLPTSELLVALGERKWHRIVLGPMNQLLAQVQGQELSRGGCRVMVRNCLGRSAHEVADDPAPKVQPKSLGKVGHSGERHDALEPKRVWPVERRLRGDLVAAAQPERKVPSRGVAKRHRTVGKDGEAPGELRDEVGCSPNILQGPREASARLPDPPVLKTEDGVAGLGEGCAKVAQMGQVILRPPEAAVDGDDQRVGARTRREPEVAELEPLRSVRDSVGRVRGF
jgi:hypothetical protein